MKNLNTIGSKEYVSFPDLGIENVPAKVDTGADYSAVWASNISEQAGELSFTLFDSGYQLFTGTTIRTKEYGVTKVKNSFGHQELRYKVKLSCKIGKRKIKVEFRLADRSQNRYPILIGKKTLHNRFVVNVAQNNILVSNVKKQILVFNSLPSESVKAMVSNLNKQIDDATFSYATYDDYLIHLGTDKRIEIINLATNKPLGSLDLIYFKTYFKRSEFAVAIAEYAAMCGINFIDSEIAHYHALTKLSQYARLARYDVLVPESLIAHYSKLGNQYDRFVDTLGLPFILKDTAAEKGLANYLVHNKSEFDQVVKQAVADEAYYVAQKFIPNNGDYRFIVFDKKVKTVFKRVGGKDTHLSNTSQGGEATMIDLQTVNPDVIAIAVRAAMLLNREVAGVDLMQDTESGEWYVLEVNNSPQLASGAFTDDKAKELAKFLSSYAEK